MTWVRFHNASSSNPMEKGEEENVGESSLPARSSTSVAWIVLLDWHANMYALSLRPHDLKSRRKLIIPAGNRCVILWERHGRFR